MGCSFSAEAPDRRPEQEEEEDALPVSLSAENREAIRSSWREIQEDISRVGVIMLFETHPECKDAFFTFRDLNDVNTLRASKELKAHGLRIMYIIEKTVARIDQDDRLDQLILDLGRKHYQYKALPKYYDVSVKLNTVVEICFHSAVTLVQVAWFFFIPHSHTQEQAFQYRVASFSAFITAKAAVNPSTTGTPPSPHLALIC
uniref:Neuroglobin-like n=1 Tax=Neolamprologus brichardi TaxID=32507 RepID=A0A3Q4G6V0_NEOBR